MVNTYYIIIKLRFITCFSTNPNIDILELLNIIKECPQKPNKLCN